MTRKGVKLSEPEGISGGDAAATLGKIGLIRLIGPIRPIGPIRNPSASGHQPSE
jgi:hypothetical protein